MTQRKLPSDSKVLITGLIRDGAHCIQRDIEKLLSAAKIFKDVHVLVIESDSQDQTLNRLASLAARNTQIRYVSLGQLKDIFPSRTDRLAHCRNTYLAELRNNPLYADVDYVIVADLDGMNDLLNSDSLASCWDVSEDWCVITANQEDSYYDIWALRHSDWCPDDCQALLARLEPLFGHETALSLAVESRQIRISPSRPLIPVQSAFGGLAIYTASAMQCGAYRGQDENGNEVCEHVSLHLQMTKAGHAIYLNPRLINTGLNTHTRNKRTSKIIKRAIREHIKRRRDK